MSERRRFAIIFFAVLCYFPVCGQNSKLLILNKSLFSVEGRDTILVLENVGQMGTSYCHVIPFERNSYVGLLDSNYSILLEPKYHMCGSELEYQEGLLKVSKGHEGVGYLDSSGKEIIILDHLCSCCFENNWAGSFSKGYAISYNGDWFVTDRTGHTSQITAVESLFSTSLQNHFVEFDSKGIVLFKTTDNLHGIIVDGKIGVPPSYAQITLHQSDSRGIWADCKDNNDKIVGTYYIDNSVKFFKVE